MAFTGRASELACGLLLGLILLLPWLQMPPPGEAQSGAGRGDQTSFDEAVAAWRDLMAAVQREGETALRPAVQTQNLRAAGDTLWMRYPGLWGELPQSLRQRFQLAALSNDPLYKRELLRPLLSHDDPRVRQRAWLETARVRLREADTREAQVALEQALAEPVPAQWQADTHLMLAVVALQSQDREVAISHLQQAIALDAGFWDARQLRLRVLSESLATAGQSRTACLRRSQRLLEDLGALPALADSHDQFRLLADRFATLGERGHPAFGLLAGLAYHWVGESSAARRVLANSLDAPSHLPADCAAELTRSARQLLARLAP